MSDNNDLFDNDDNSIVPSVDSQLAEARKLISAGDHDNAMPKVREVLRQDKNNTSALWLYANLVRNDNTDKAITALKRLLAVDASHAKAKAMLDKLEDDDLFNDDSPALRQSSQQAPAQAAPVIHVNVQNTAQAQAGYGAPMGGPMQQRNSTAFVAGLIAGWLFGFFGVAHLFNGKIGAGLGYLVLSIVWWVVAGVITGITAGFGACVVLPLHWYLVWRNANDGAAQIAYPQQMGGMHARM